VLPRWQFIAALLNGALPGVNVDVDALLASEGPPAPGQEAEAMKRILTGDGLSEYEVSQLQQFVDQAGPGQEEDAFGLAASLPGFQWY
jgi:hypothetical protein